MARLEPRERPKATESPEVTRQAMGIPAVTYGAPILTDSMKMVPREILDAAPPLIVEAAEEMPVSSFTAASTIVNEQEKKEEMEKKLIFQRGQDVIYVSGRYGDSAVNPLWGSIYSCTGKIIDDVPEGNLARVIWGNGKINGAYSPDDIKLCPGVVKPRLPKLTIEDKRGYITVTTDVHNKFANIYKEHKRKCLHYPTCWMLCRNKKNIIDKIISINYRKGLPQNGCIEMAALTAEMMARAYVELIKTKRHTFCGIIRIGRWRIEKEGDRGASLIEIGYMNGLVISYGMQIIIEKWHTIKGKQILGYKVPIARITKNKQETKTIRKEVKNAKKKDDQSKSGPIDTAIKG